MKLRDQSKYGTLLKVFLFKFALGNEHYPKNITAATDVLYNKKFYPKLYKNEKH